MVYVQIRCAECEALFYALSGEECKCPQCKSLVFVF